MGCRLITPRIENSVVYRAPVQKSLDREAMRILYYQIPPQRLNKAKHAPEKKMNQSLINNDFGYAHLVLFQKGIAQKPSHIYPLHASERISSKNKLPIKMIIFAD
jgi:hypothetical protein